MEDEGLSVGHAADAALHMAFRLARLVHWLIFIAVHLLLWCLLLTVLWWTDARPTTLASAYLQWLARNPVAAVLLSGLSGLGVVVAWWRAATWALTRTRSGWLRRYLTKGLF